MLQMRAPGHHRAAMGLRLLGERARRGGDVALEHGQAVAHLQDERRIHDVLGGGAPMDIARRVLAGGAAERLGHADDGISDNARAGAEFGEVDTVDRGRRRDRVRRRLRDDAEPRLRPGERRLDVEHLLHELPVREDAAHLVGAEQRAEDL